MEATSNGHSPDGTRDANQPARARRERPVRPVVRGRHRGVVGAEAGRARSRRPFRGDGAGRGGGARVHRAVGAPGPPRPLAAVRAAVPRLAEHVEPTGGATPSSAVLEQRRPGRRPLPQRAHPPVVPRAQAGARPAGAGGAVGARCDAVLLSEDVLLPHRRAAARRPADLVQGADAAVHPVRAVPLQPAAEPVDPAALQALRDEAPRGVGRDGAGARGESPRARSRPSTTASTRAPRSAARRGTRSARSTAWSAARSSSTADASTTARGPST